MVAGGWRWVVPGQVPVWVSGGRWGPRRVRIYECAALLAAELVFGRLLTDGEDLCPGWRAVVSWTPEDGSGTSWKIDAEVL